MINRKGFTLLELMVVVGILSILAMTVAPGLLKLQVEKKFTDNLKNNIMNVLDAARQYRFDCGQWPANITNLTSPPPGCSGNPSQNPYLPQGFQLVNPFGGAITFSGQPNFFSLNVPVNAQYGNLIGYFRDLPGFTQTPQGFQTTVVSPGLEASLQSLDQKYVLKTGDTMTGNLVLAGNAYVDASDFRNRTSGTWESANAVRWVTTITLYPSVWSFTFVPKPSCPQGTLPHIYGAVVSPMMDSAAPDASVTVGGYSTVPRTITGARLWASDLGVAWRVWGASYGLCANVTDIVCLRPVTALIFTTCV